MIKLYTDGAYSHKLKLGSFAVIRVVGLKGINAIEVSSGVLDDHPTCNIAELMGVIEALRYIERRKNKHGEIYSDSQYVVCSYNEWMERWERLGWRRKNNDLAKNAVKNLDLIKEMFRLKELLPNVNVEWVRGHDGNEFNELADEVACALIYD